MLKKQYLIAIIVVVSFILSINLSIFLYILGIDKKTHNKHVISEIQIDNNSSKNTKGITFIDLLIPLPERNKDISYVIRPELTNNMNLKSITIEINYLNLKQTRRVLIESSKLNELMSLESSIIKWLLISEYRKSDYNGFKRNVLLASKTGYSWWNLYRNIKLLIYLCTKETILPEGLSEISILKFKDYEGFLEEYISENEIKYYGYNFVIGQNAYNIILSGYTSKLDIVNFIKSMRIKL